MPCVRSTQSRSMHVLRRGPILEVIVSRMRYIAAHTAKHVRFVGLSTAVANAQDLADWLGIGPKASPARELAWSRLRLALRSVAAWDAPQACQVSCSSVSLRGTVSCLVPALSCQFQSSLRYWRI